MFRKIIMLRGSAEEVPSYDWVDTPDFDMAELAATSPYSGYYYALYATVYSS